MAVKAYALTYSQCDLPKEAMFTALQHLMPNVQALVVAQEQHKDGKPHIHAYIRYSNVMKRETCEFDIEDIINSDTYHPNVKICSNPKGWLQYITKEDENPLVFGEVKLPKKPKSKYPFLEQNKELLAITPIEAIDKGLVSLKNFKSYDLSWTLYWSQQLTIYDHETTRGLWIYGQPGTGKSTWARAFLKHHYQNFYYHQLNKWWDNYRRELSVLLEEVNDSHGEWIADKLLVWTDRHGFTAEVKGGQAIPPQHRLFVITSNLTISEVFVRVPSAITDAIRRRCIEGTIVTINGQQRFQPHAIQHDEIRQFRKLDLQRTTQFMI